MRIYNVIFTVSISGGGGGVCAFAGVERQSRIKMPSAPDRTTAAEDRAHVLTSSSSSQQCCSSSKTTTYIIISVCINVLIIYVVV